MPAGAEDGLPVVPFASAAEWDAWLRRACGGGVWLRIAEHEPPGPGGSYADASAAAGRNATATPPSA